VKKKNSIVGKSKEECHVKVATGLKNPYEVERNLTGKIITTNLSLQILQDKYLLMELGGKKRKRGKRVLRSAE